MLKETFYKGVIDLDFRGTWWEICKTSSSRGGKGGDDFTEVN